MKNKSLIFLLFIIISIPIYSQEFIASVNSNKISLSEQLEVDFTFSGSDINSISQFVPPAFSDFIVLSGPNQSTKMQIINGAISAERTFSFYLQPKRVGKFTIGSASIKYKGETLQSNPITIEVFQGSSSNKNKNNNDEVNTNEIADNLFIRAIADKNTAYLGEQVTVTYKLYTRLNIASLQVEKLPSYQGFWTEEIETSNNITFTRENYNGKLFNVGILKKVALFPSQTGQLSVTPFSLNIPVYVQKKKRSNDPFEDFFNDPFFGNNQQVNYTAVSNTVKINAIPLPKTNEVSFTGAVGDFDFKVNLNKNIAKQNEPITLSINISGTGNIKLLQLPNINFSDGFEVYDPKISENIIRQSVVSGSKKFEYVLIPRVSGELTIPEIKFTYFNLKNKKYETFTQNEIKIKVEPGSGEYASGQSNYNKESIRELGKDIRYIKTSFNDVEKENGYLISQPLFIGVTLIPLLGLIGLFVWKQREEKISADINLLRNRQAEKIAKKRLKIVSKYLTEKNSKLFYDEVSKALSDYLENKLNISKSEFTIEKAANILISRNIDENLVVRLRALIEKCEFIRYAPSANGIEEMNNIYNEVKDVIISLEESLSNNKVKV